MVFNSISFLVFFPIATALYFVCPARARWALLLLMSVYVYMTFIPEYILILAALIFVDYVAGRTMERAEGTQRIIILLLSVCANIGTVFFFKYLHFANDTIREFFVIFHLPYAVTIPSFLLPIGLSFHTFQSLSYVIEVYRKRVPVEHHLGIYALYVMFYPQLIAGPIERPGHLLPQLRAMHQWDYERVTSGLSRMLWGFVQKTVIADRLAPFVDRVYGAPGHYPGISILIATVFFSVQIYCDFAGYTDIAIGAAKVMGIELTNNFAAPYLATNIREFWRRWHISLTTWFRDYVYIPLGGNRVSRVRFIRNILVVFLLSGLWHGANATFVVWGFLHGLWYLGSVFLEKFRSGVAGLMRYDRFPLIRTLIQRIIMFAFVSFAWIFFRAGSLSDAGILLSRITSGFRDLPTQLTNAEFINANVFLGEGAFAFLIALVGIVALFMMDGLKQIFAIDMRFREQPALLKFIVLAGSVACVVLFGQLHRQQFIYFQF